MSKEVYNWLPTPAAVFSVVQHISLFARNYPFLFLVSNSCEH